ncbi:hypothetical protein DB88DRAFT_470772 [Papiliotrema laurentii]|uniref:BTB domain-containing protein n=1 Tax=Papiliotrema laurentii TaxID=5418 RepID=A0AAD9L7J1_PAPLA|nr:hypothetical protein DB88DRAFT_470772 [Papiliotrema laurentii]
MSHIPRTRQIILAEYPMCKVDSHFNDPSADILFRSQSGTHFRMSSWYLAKHSKFFANVRAIAQPTKPEPIELNLPDQVIRELLQCIHSCPPPSGSVFKSLSMGTIENGYDLGMFFEEFGFVEAREHYYTDSLERMSSDPWTYFKLASDKNNEALALIVLEDHISRPLASFDIGTLPLYRYEWRLPLVTTIEISKAYTGSIRETGKNAYEIFSRELAIAKRMLGLRTVDNQIQTPNTPRELDSKTARQHRETRNLDVGCTSVLVVQRIRVVLPVLEWCIVHDDPYPPLLLN